MAKPRACAAHSRGAVMRWLLVVDGRLIASFGARAGAVGGTHSTGCRARFRMPFGRGRRPPVLAPVSAPATAQRGEGLAGIVGR